jgi:hypothetical protein
MELTRETGIEQVGEIVSSTFFISLHKNRAMKIGEHKNIQTY